MNLTARFWSAVDAAIEAVIGAAIDVICREWIEETAQAAKEEGQAEADALHVHGAWCHPSADGCPDRPGM